MANPAFSMVFKDKEVVFAALTGDGVEGENGSQYTLATKFTKKEKKSLVEEVMEFYEDHNKNGKPPRNDPNDWFSESEDDDGTFIFWVNCPVDADQKPNRRLKRKRAPGTKFGIDEFETIGAGSVVDFKVRFYWFEYKRKEGVGRALQEVVLKEYVPYEGADDGVSTEGEVIGSDGVDEKSPDKFSDLIDEIEEAIEDGDAKGAKLLLKKLPKDHAAYKRLKKEIKSL